MKILYVLNSGTPGGMEQHVLYLVQGMVARRHEVHVWCKKGEITGWFQKAGAHVSEASIKFDIDPVYISALAYYLEDNKIDVCHSHELKAVANSLLAGNRAKTKVRITHTHTPISEWPADKMITRIKRKAQTRIYSTLVNKLASAEIALTPSRREVKLKEGISPDRLKVIPNCYNSAAFSPAPDTAEAYRREIRERYGIPVDALVFGNVSRLSVEKNQEFMINAFACLASEVDVPVYLLIAGGGVLEEKLKKLIEELNLSGRVIITGVFKQEDLPKYYYASDVFVFPTKAEGFGLVLIEAMGAGLPVLASDLVVLKEVAGDTVDYFSLQNTQNLTKMLNSYLAYYVKHRTIPVNQKALERAKKLYTEEAFILQYEELYGSFLN